MGIGPKPQGTVNTVTPANSLAHLKVGSMPIHAVHIGCCLFRIRGGIFFPAIDTRTNERVVLCKVFKDKLEYSNNEPIDMFLKTEKGFKCMADGNVMMNKNVISFEDKKLTETDLVFLPELIALDTLQAHKNGIAYDIVFDEKETKPVEIIVRSWISTKSYSPKRPTSNQFGNTRSLEMAGTTEIVETDIKLLHVSAEQRIIFVREEPQSISSF